MLYLFKYHQYEWLHQLTNARFSLRNASVQNTNNNKPCLRGGNIGRSSLRSSESTFNEPIHANSTQMNVSTSTPTTPPLIFIRSVVTMWDRDSNINSTVRRTCNTDPKFEFTYFFSILLEYLRYIEHWIHPNMKMRRKSKDEVAVSSKQELRPWSIHASVNSVLLLQNNILMLLEFSENQKKDFNGIQLKTIL